MTPYVEQIITERDSLAAHDEAVNGMGIYGYTADQMQAAWQAGRDSNDALLRMALDALKQIDYDSTEDGALNQVITALRERLGEKV